MILTDQLVEVLESHRETLPVEPHPEVLAAQERLTRAHTALHFFTTAQHPEDIVRSIASACRRYCEAADDLDRAQRLYHRV